MVAMTPVLGEKLISANRFRTITCALVTLLLTASCSGGNGKTGSDLPAILDTGEMAPGALHTVAPTSQAGSAGATAVLESSNLPAIMNDSGEELTLTPLPPNTQNSAVRESPPETKQAQATCEALADDLVTRSVSLLPPTEIYQPTPTPDQRSQRHVQPAQVTIEVTRIIDYSAIEVTREVIPESSLPPLATATRRPATEPVATGVVRSESKHFSGCAARTGSNATIAVPLDAAINGLILESGDEIAVFTLDGSLCAGSAVWTGQNIGLTVWGDDSQTEEVDGLHNGEEMKFRIWDMSVGQEISLITVEYAQGNTTYAEEGIYIVDAFTLE